MESGNKSLVSEGTTYILLEKLSNFITRGNFSFPPSDAVKSYIDVFEVAKASDIRPVFNGRSSGINDSIWAPHFQLPTGTYMVHILDDGFKVHRKVGLNGSHLYNSS